MVDSPAELKLTVHTTPHATLLPTTTSAVCLDLPDRCISCRGFDLTRRSSLPVVATSTHISQPAIQPRQHPFFPSPDFLIFVPTTPPPYLPSAPFRPPNFISTTIPIAKHIHFLPTHPLHLKHSKVGSARAQRLRCRSPQLSMDAISATPFQIPHRTSMHNNANDKFAL
ncbi:hypothetical protein K505DRAFT_329079 [Melanomma pulvis-pyrius CBS 109.77]|uniref:Uncharacterized protein n=1 Tax=Melanomma pulvis-pyrius CBS 109.77 TaxID=1314802 RepID=A0A6A6WVS4_9PLEO|nr:hypothetical protein K505DRAFT_329079 [Melanomma pulvis-pyrius CBS 109.77]